LRFHSPEVAKNVERNQQTQNNNLTHFINIASLEPIIPLFQEDTYKKMDNSNLMQNLLLYRSGGGNQNYDEAGLGPQDNNSNLMQNLLLYRSGGGNQNYDEAGQGPHDQMGYGGFPAGGLLASYLQQQHQQEQQTAAAHAAAMGESSLQNFSGLGSGLAYPAQHGLMNQPTLNSEYEANRFLLQKAQQGGNWIGDMSGEGDPYAENGILGPWSATSAGLLGNMAISNQGKGKKMRKKPKDKPKRPLSAYNIFFREERNRILEEIPEADSKEESADGTGRKRKKRPHGKIGFESLAKVIGQRWQALTPDQVDYYKKKAQGDMVRYKHEMDAYVAKEGKKAHNDDSEGSQGDQAYATANAESNAAPDAKRLKLDS
jgi:hypothetical protein